MKLVKKDSFGIEINYTEMSKLEWLLQEAEIPYRIEYIWGDAFHAVLRPRR